MLSSIEFEVKFALGFYKRKKKIRIHLLISVHSHITDYLYHFKKIQI